MINVHVRALPISLEKAGRLIDELATEGDLLWPKADWPAMRLDRPLGVGARGGHGPIRYEIIRYVPGQTVKFRFNATRGFGVGLEGEHRFELTTSASGDSWLTHVVEAKLRGRMKFIWPQILEPLHDALVEDALDRAVAFATGVEVAHRWTPHTIFLRRLVRIASPA